MKTTRQAIIFILLASISAGAGQLFWKKASFALTSNLFSLLNIYLITGILLYVLGTVFMILSFRNGELSVLHPFLATSYIWVTLIAPLIIPTETLSMTKLIGVFIIFGGVALIGIGGRKS